MNGLRLFNVAGDENEKHKQSPDQKHNKNIGF